MAETINKALTIEQLFAECVKQLKKGNGKKHILITSDDEGNEFHELFFGIDENSAEYFKGDYPPFLPYGVRTEDLKDYVVLG